MSGSALWLRAGILMLVLASMAEPALAANSSSVWDLSVRSAYALDARTYWFDARHNLSIAASRRLGARFAVVASGGYARNTSPVQPGLVWIPEVRLEEVGRQASILPLALGLRYSPFGNRPEHPQPFLEIAPTLYWYRYRAQLETTNGFTGARIVDCEAFDRVAPGFQVTAMVPVPLFPHFGIDMGLTYYFSAHLSQRDLLLASSPFHNGMNTLAATFGIRLRP